MKKLILLLAVLLTYCKNKNDRHLSEIHCEFNGGVILSISNYAHFVGDPTGSEHFYTIKYKGEILEFIQPYEIDDHYNTGDTIKGNCIK